MKKELALRLLLGLQRKQRIYDMIVITWCSEPYKFGNRKNYKLN